ncbi:hypothetical protein AJ80_05687 [Polytolypa hystricis UAMH7299]|uniref:Mitochondrial fission process protein 1 n=1 Tax=Polytolypa hystricis (strain UAMH7299) TaxID=1447883 RepID=A0A2B7Y2H4_POLH7|nr:hypothetical protein AJ80_05687 [Polytolypa hystricis UAMH7299]
MLWNSKDDESHSKQLPSAEASQALQKHKLPPELQTLVDHEEDFLDQLYDGYSPDSVDTSYRYAAYATRIRTLLLSARRYIAYTSEIGESFRPVAHPWLVRSAYGISWAYILTDVANEGYKAYLRNRNILAPASDAYRNATHVTPVEPQLDAVARQKLQQLSTLDSTISEQHPVPWPDPDADTLVPWSTRRIPLSEDYRSIMAERGVFQAIASMGLPAFTIHSLVKYSGRAMKNVKSTVIRTWGPIGLALSVVPFLPYIFDAPVEHAVHWSFERFFLAVGGPDAIAHRETDATKTSKTFDILEEAQHRRKERQEKKEKKE